MQALTPNLGLAVRRALGTGGGGEDAISTAELTKTGYCTQNPCRGNLSVIGMFRQSGYERDVTLTTKGRKMVSVDRVTARRIGPRTLGSVSIVMSTACLVSISFPYKTFAFVPPVLFPWHYSPVAFLLWIAACVTFSVIAGVWGSRLWLNPTPSSGRIHVLDVMSPVSFDRGPKSFPYELFYKSSDIPSSLGRERLMVATRILLVDDSEQWRLLVRSMLQSNSWFRIVGEATDGVDAIEKAATLVPDVVLLDIGMPRLNGIEAAKEIKQACPESRIIFLTQEADSDIQNVALANGAFAYLLKSRASHELRTTIETAMLVSSYPC